MPPQCDPSKHADVANGQYSAGHECHSDTPLWPPHHLHRRQTGLYWKPLVYLGLVILNDWLAVNAPRATKKPPRRRAA
jgi:hypothetical protein